MKTYKFKLNFKLDKASIASINWRPFWAGLIGGLIMAFIVNILSFLKISPMKIVTPAIKSIQMDIMNTLLPKLEKKPNTYKLNKSNNLISSVNISLSDNPKAYLVVDYEKGQIISEKSASDRLQIASLTKLMTAVVALDLAIPTQLFTITNNAAGKPPTAVGVVPGEKMKLDELLHASLMTSANDATEAIRDGVDQQYGQPIFLRAMNKKAQFLGLKNTHFTNPSGFDNPGNYSTARDLAVLTHYALTNYPLIADIVKKDYAFLPEDVNHKQFDLYNWNGLLDVYPETTGVKIGNTDEAKTTMIVISERENKKILVVVLGSEDVLNRDLAAAKLLDLGYERTLNLPPVNVTAFDLQQKYATWKYWN